MLSPFRHQHPELTSDRDRAFPALLIRVLRELANPTPPFRLASQIRQRSLAHPAPSPERNLAMTAQPAVSETHANLLLFTPLDAAGGRGMSRSSVAFALVFNAALIALLGIQVHHHVFVDKPPIMTLVAPPEKLPEPARPKFTPKVIPLKTATVQPISPAILRRTAELLPAPVTPTPVARHETPVVPMPPSPSPRVVPAIAPPTIRTVELTTTPVAIQPTGPAVATLNLTRASGPGAAAVPGISSPGLPGPRASTGSIGPAGPVHLPGCSGCGPGNSDRNVVPRPLEARVLPPPPEVHPPVATPPTPPARSAPTVLFKPLPKYTPEAAALHLEGTVKVMIRLAADGTVTVLRVASGLGHGLDESAVQCVQGIRFKPAVDASGKPVSWEGLVSITFQIA